MKKKLLWALVIIVVVAVIGFRAWRTGILARLYRSYVPVGEVSASQVQGINNVGFPEKNRGDVDFSVPEPLNPSKQIKDRQPDAAFLAALPAISQASPDFLVS